MITEFKGTYAFLSSFAPIPVKLPWFHDWEAPTREHGFQAAKCADWQDMMHVLHAQTPGEAKKRGRAVKMRAGWDGVKREVMLELALIQFRQPGPRTSLAATGDHVLVEGNTWGDTYWGAIRSAAPALPSWGGPDDQGFTLSGHNWLGRVLMMVRDVTA